MKTNQKIFKFWLSKNNIPYTESSSDRPSFMDYKGTFTRDWFIGYYFGEQADYNDKYCTGNFEFTSFDTAVVYVNGDSYSNNPGYVNWTWDKYMTPNAMMVYDKLTEDTPRFYFITNITLVGNATYRYDLKLDYWLTYWHNGKDTSVTLDPNKSVLVHRRPEKRYKPISFIQEQWMLEIAAGESFSIVVFPSYNWPLVYAHDKDMYAKWQQGTPDKRQTFGKYTCLNGTIKVPTQFIDCRLELIGPTGKVAKVVEATLESMITVDGENYVQVLKYTAGAEDERYYGFNISTAYSNNWGGYGSPPEVQLQTFVGCAISLDCIIYNQAGQVVLPETNQHITWNIQIDDSSTFSNAGTYDPEQYLTSKLWTYNKYPDGTKDKDILKALTTLEHSIQTVEIAIEDETQTTTNYKILNSGDIGNGQYVGFTVEMLPQVILPLFQYIEGFNFENNIPLPDVKMLVANLFSDSIVNNIDPEMSHLTATSSYLPLNEHNFDRDISAIQSFSNNILFATASKTSKYEVGQSYCYALVSFLSNLGAPSGAKMPTVYSSWTQPLILCPLVIGDDKNNSYSGFLSAGSPAVVKIFMTDFPLISNTIWDDPSKFKTIHDISGGDYAALNDSKGVFLGDIINDLYVIEKGVYKETYDLRNLPFELFVTIDTPKYKSQYNYMYEVNLYTYPFTKIELINGTTSREIRLNNLWGNKLDYLNNIDISCRYVMNDTLFNKIGFINNGVYGLASDTAKAAYMSSAGYDLPSTGSAYTNFYQNHLNSYNTSKWAFGMQFGSALLGIVNPAAMLGFMGSMSGLTKTKNPLIGPAAGVGSGILSGVGAGMQLAVQNAQLNAQVQDLERQPMTISGSSNGDIYSMVATTKDIFNESGKLTSTPNTYLNVMFPNDATAKYIAYYYHINGNISNQYENLTKEVMNTRSIFNYWKIDRIQSGLVLNSLPNEVIEWFNNAFNNGLRLWNHEPSVQDPGSLWYNYNLENWENELL